MKKTFITLVAVMAGAIGMPVQAELEAAKELWLEGDDASSLSMLAEMAQGGDADARLLLGRIETMDRGPSRYRLKLKPEERRDLFRQKTVRHRFGRSWIAVEAENGNPLAAVLLKSRLPQPDPKLMGELWALGEREATDHPTRIVALYGTDRQKIDLLASRAMLDDLRPYIAFLRGAAEPRGDGMAALRHIAKASAHEIDATDPDALGMAGILALGYGYGDASGENKWRRVVGDWIMTAPSTKPIAELCSSECGDDAGNCAFAFLALTGGYFEAIRLDTPLEAAISQQRFLDSPRARIMTLRRAALARGETNLDWLANREEMARMSSCAADLITAERQRYEFE